MVVGALNAGGEQEGKKGFSSPKLALAIYFQAVRVALPKMKRGCLGKADYFGKLVDVKSHATT